MSAPAHSAPLQSGAWAGWAPQKLEEIVQGHAPGVASAERGWTGALGAAEEFAPDLWRIGSGSITDGRPHHPFPVALPLLDESHLQVWSVPGTRPDVERLVETLLLRTALYCRPGWLYLHVWDAQQSTGSLPGLYPLTRTGLRTDYGPADLRQLTRDLSTQVKRVHTKVLVGGLATLKEAASDVGRQGEPWHVAVLLGAGQPLPDREHQEVEQVARQSLACGISLVTVDLPIHLNAPFERVRITPDGCWSSLYGHHVTVTLDEPPPREEIVAACHRVADEHDRFRSRVGTFEELLPPLDQWGLASSKAGLVAPVGFFEGRPVEARLDDASPHALIGSPSGQGKTNYLLTWIMSLATRYDPRELAFYLLDFKDGVSFQLFGLRQDGSWLPHARRIGVNINDDREHGLELLRFLSREMRRRAKLAKTYEVANLADLREQALHEELPRIVAVIDEFQYLFAEKDAITKDAAKLFEDIARRGRSHGIHLVVATQDFTSINAFFTRQEAVFGQFMLRVALRGARKILQNEAAMALPQYSAIVNHERGADHAHQEMRTPDASAHGALDEVRRQLHAMYESVPPPLADGAKSPKLVELLGRLPPSGTPVGVLGERMDIHANLAVLDLEAGSGRNLAVMGNGGAAPRLLELVATSLAGQGKVRYVDLRQPADYDGMSRLVRALARVVRARRRGGERAPLFLVVQAAHIANGLPKLVLAEWLQVLQNGPEVGVHVLGWWRTPERLKELVGNARDMIGVLVGLDVQAGPFGDRIGPAMSLSWDGRDGRALWFDRSWMRAPEAIVLPAEVEADG